MKNADVKFQTGVNILVGDNETGKSTVLEAINLALTRQLNRRDAGYELHPYLFHLATAQDFVRRVCDGETLEPISILIEVYFDDLPKLALHKGENNTARTNCPGVSLSIELDDRFSEEYAAYIADTERLATIPIEYYHIVWRDFSGETMSLREAPIRPAMIDPSALTNSFAANRYVLELARDFLTRDQHVQLALSYRQMREIFQKDASVDAINRELAKKKGVVSERELSMALDMTSKAGWETSVMPHLDDLPLILVGKGEQTSVKIKLALEAAEACQVLLIEEPENHLSHSNLSGLIGHIADRSAGKQLIITTHSSFVLNKLGVDATIMFDGASGVRLSDLPPDTRRYFMRLPGHNTLRMVLAMRSILVEGPSDELIVQKAYKQRHGRMPLEDGVEVITVNSLAFRRFLDIAELLSLDVTVATDNDGKPEKLDARYAPYADKPNISICYSGDPALKTLEHHLVALNDLAALNAALGEEFATKDAVEAHMLDHKADAALSLFETAEIITMPQYILDAVR